MFRSLIEELRDALDEGPEGKKLLPWNRPDEKTMAKHREAYAKIAGSEGHRFKKYKRGKSPVMFGVTSPDPNDPYVAPTGKKATS
jgi:hypothetical protein